MIGVLQVPEAFAEDLFAVLGERDRPDYRSTFRVTCVHAQAWTGADCPAHPVELMRFYTFKKIVAGG